MNLNEYQDEAAKTAVFPGAGNIDNLGALNYTVLGLTGEAGELANLAKKIYRDHGSISMEHRVKLSRELGDVLWYVAAVARQLGYPLDVIAKENLDKLRSRAERGVIGGSGDDR